MSQIHRKPGQGEIKEECKCIRACLDEIGLGENDLAVDLL